jgi:hypothetical protein
VIGRTWRHPSEAWPLLLAPGALLIGRLEHRPSEPVALLGNRDTTLAGWRRTADIPEGLPFDHDGTSLSRARIWNLTTPFGEFHISFVPSGTQGYEDLARHALVIESYGQLVPVADLDDVIRSKEAAGRPKDILHLLILLQTSQRLHPERGKVARETGPDIGF